MRTERSDNIARITLTSSDEAIHLDSEHILRLILPTDVAVRLDLSVIELLRSSELAALVEIHKALYQTGKDFALCGLNSGNKKLLQMTRLDQLFNVRP